MHPLHFVDATIEHAIKQIRSLGLHEGINSHHVIMLYMDCDRDLLFKGGLNCPVLNLAIRFVVEHADNCKKFLERFQKLAEDKNFEQHIIQDSQDFETHGASEINLRRVCILDQELKECMMSAVKMVAKK